MGLTACKQNKICISPHYSFHTAKTSHVKHEHKKQSFTAVYLKHVSLSEEDESQSETTVTKLMTAKSCYAASVLGAWFCACWLTFTLSPKQNGVIINVISSTKSAGRLWEKKHGGFTSDLIKQRCETLFLILKTLDRNSRFIDALLLDLLTFLKIIHQLIESVQ